MKIDLNSPATELIPKDWSAQKPSQSNGLAPLSATEDRVTLASAGATVESLTAQAMSTPQIRQNTVDALRQAISSGSYRPDSTEIASAISAHENQ